jgi:arylsulfatase A-like enzyme
VLPVEGVANVLCKMRATLFFLVAVVANAGTCDPSTYEKDTSYSAGDNHTLGVKPAASADECCGLCVEDSSCTSWTWRGAGKNECKMMDSPAGAGRKHNPDHTAGPGNPPGPPSPPAPPSPPGPPTPPAPIPKDKPNFVLIVTDDQDALLNGYDPKVGIKHMDKLNNLVRSEGTLFTRYYDAYALCSPSRSTILTGRYPHNHGFTTNSDLEKSGFHPVQERDTLNVWLNRTGYHTTIIGKYMNGYHGTKYQTYIPPGWGHFYGFQDLSFYGSRVNMNGPSKLFPKDVYQTDLIANLSLNWLENEWERKRPFFMFITPHAPHDPHTPAKKYQGTLAGLVQPPNPSFNLAVSLPGLADLKEQSAKKMDETFQQRAECLLSIDDMIGDIVDKLQQLNQLDKTYIMFTSDNGYHLGQHRLPGGKRLFFEHDINLPLIVRGPKIAKGGTIDNMVGNQDFASTIAELAGAKPTSGAPIVDGLSWAGLITGANTAWPRNAALSEGYQDAEGGVKCCGQYHALRIHSSDTDALYVETGSGDTAYFDNAADPNQCNNTISSLSSDKKADLAKRLAAIKSCKGLQCVLASDIQGLLV